MTVHDEIQKPCSYHDWLSQRVTQSAPLGAQVAAVAWFVPLNRNIVFSGLLHFARNDEGLRVRSSDRSRFNEGREVVRAVAFQ